MAFNSNTRFEQIISRPEHQLDLTDIMAALGEDTPSMGPNEVGRMRLLDMLARKFGPNFRTIPAAQRALGSFEQQFGSLKELLEGMESLNRGLG